MNLEEILGNEELAGALKNHFLSGDNVTAFLEGESGKKTFQSMYDKRFEKSLGTWKENNLEKLIQQRVAELNPAETEEQKMIKQLQQDLAKAQKDNKLSSLRASFGGKFSEAGLPIEMMDFVMGDDEETTSSRFTQFNELMKSYKNGIIESELKADSQTVVNAHQPNTEERYVDPVVQTRDAIAEAFSKAGL